MKIGSSFLSREIAKPFSLSLNVHSLSKNRHIVFKSLLLRRIYFSVRGILLILFRLISFRFGWNLHRILLVISMYSLLLFWLKVLIKSYLTSLRVLWVLRKMENCFILNKITKAYCEGSSQFINLEGTCSWFGLWEARDNKGQQDFKMRKWEIWALGIFVVTTRLSLLPIHPNIRVWLKVHIYFLFYIYTYNKSLGVTWKKFR